ncbi:MAG: polyketide cyclase, partial [Nocardioides sp.]
CVEEKRLQLKGDAGDSLTLLDTITLEPTLEGGTSLTYHAEFTLHGVAKLTTPLMPPALKVLADSVADQLERTLSEL